MKTSVKFDRNSYVFIQENELANAVCKVAAISFRPQCAKCDFASIDRALSPCGCGDLSVRLGSRLSPHRHRVVVEVHWRGAQGWRSISWVVATFNHVGGSFNLSMAATGDVWIIPSFRIWGYVLHVEHISCVIMNCGQLQWAIITWYDGFLPPVRCISAPGTTLFGPVVCLHCFNFVNTPPPQISMKLRWVTSVN